MAEKTYAEYQEEIRALEEQAEAARKKELASVIEDCRAKIRTYNLSARDLGLAAGEKTAKRTGPGLGGKVAPKYRNGEQEWTGRGKKPIWVRDIEASGGNIEAYRIA